MFDLRVNRLTAAVAFFILMAFSVSGYADDIEDSIKEALQYYGDGEYKDTLESLNYASQLLQQKKGEGLESFLPKPLKGWTGQKSTSQAAGASMFGGGVTAQRKYTKGSSSITVEIITDSPLMQGMMMMFSNPMFAAADGGKLERIGRQKAVVKFNPDNKQGEIKMVVANRFLVLIEGDEITKEILKGYANAIDYKKLKALE